MSVYRLPVNWPCISTGHAHLGRISHDVCLQEHGLDGVGHALLHPGHLLPEQAQLGAPHGELLAHHLQLLLVGGQLHALGLELQVVVLQHLEHVEVGGPGDGVPRLQRPKGVADGGYFGSEVGVVLEALQHQRQQAVLLAHQVEVALAPGGLRYGNEVGATDLHGLPRDRPLVGGEVHHEDAEREGVDFRVVVRLQREGLWRHVGGRAGRLRQVQAATGLKLDHARDAKVADLGRHVGREQHVVGREVAVDDGRGVPVQVGQAQRHVAEDGDL